MKRIKGLSALLIISVFTLALAGCRKPNKNEDWAPPDAPEFDASTDGDTDTDSDTDTDADTDTDTDTDANTDLQYDASVDGSVPPDIESDAGAKECESSGFNNNHSPYFGGDSDVQVEVNVFSSFRCSHCANLARNSKNLWEKRSDFTKHVRFYFHHFPLFKENENVWEQHLAAVAAQNQGDKHFWAIHDFIYDGLLSTPAQYYSKEDLIDFAQNVLKLDIDKFQEDFVTANTATYSFLYWDEKQGTEKGVSSTPTIFVCNQRVSWSALESTVDEYLGN